MASLVSHSSRRHCSRVSYLHPAGGYDLSEVGGAGGTQRPNHTVWGMCFPALYRTHIHFSHAVWIRRDWFWWVSVFTRWNIDDPQSLKDKTSHCVLKLDCQFKLFMNVPLTYDPPHACAHRPDWQCAVLGRPWNASVFHPCIIQSFSLVGRKCWSCCCSFSTQVSDRQKVCMKSWFGPGTLHAARDTRATKANPPSNWSLLHQPSVSKWQKDVSI